MSLHENALAFFVTNLFAKSVLSEISIVYAVHQNRPVKRAGEAGIALRARGGGWIYFTRLCASWWRAVECGRLMRCWRGCAACAASGSL
ncbi:hypothetical protein EKN97_10300 [Enterobacter hormaechei]|nr:hypothetical protein EKN58_003180 [Enterobacter hormaechei]RTM63507.1 hypothetical protein EKO16_03955 [Enterobacter hormaechei subsp. xiangfangensis]RTN38233.1 hypothetical protein EKN97_10300 [Enterobacter hormaechei]RTO13103.1 hypothetical protein EKN70_07540 [Enterobacter hormaechei]RTO28082.1 hypothetical protein EKN69_03950 [Enterobacter hormaechei]